MTVLDQFELEGEVAVITGAGRGIGEGIAHTLSEAGASVVLAARRGEEVQKVADDIVAAGGKAIAVPTDVTDDDCFLSLVGKKKQTHLRFFMAIIFIDDGAM